jgi:hypothetical protein
MENHYKNEDVEIYIQEGILHVNYFTNVLTMEIVELGIKQRMDMSAGKSYPMVADIRNIKTISLKVRSYLARPENSQLLSAGAMIVKNTFQETIGNIFIFLNRPAVPARLFTDKKEAIKWLENYK